MRHFRHLELGAAFDCRHCRADFQTVRVGPYLAFVCPVCEIELDTCNMNVGFQRMLVHAERIGQARLPLSCPPRMRYRNNLRGVITADFGSDSFCDVLMVEQPGPFSVPEIARLSSKSSAVIRTYNQRYDFLPFEIRPSFIPGAGKGVFATHNLRKNTYIGSYVGDVRKMTPEISQNNSLVEVGWIGEDFFVIAPEKHLNHARYLNGSDQQHPANVTSTWLLSGSQLHLIMYANQSIRAGSQLFWDYGANFF